MKKTRRSTRHFKGLAVSPGIAIGYVHLLESEALNFHKFWIPDRSIKGQISRFQRAIKKTKHDLMHIKEKLCKFQIGEQIDIIDSYQMIASDEMLLKEAVETIRHEKINAEWAFHKAIEKLKNSFSKTDDAYFAERREELNHIAYRILRNMSGVEGSQLKQFRKDSVIVAHELSPTDTAQMTKGMVQGFISEVGGTNSHTAIVARALEIPAVVGINGIVHMVDDGDLILIDGTEGIIFLNPSKKDLTKYREIQKKYAHFDQLLLKEAHLPSVTQDGYNMRLAANMELPEEIATIKSHGAEGIGLYRSEMLYIIQNRFPSEEEQFETYKEVLQKIHPHSVTIRTIDMGGDKIMGDWDYVEGMNPALGLRAIRYCLKQKDLLRTQLRAMLRASHYGSLKILIPMITNLEEMRHVKKIILDIEEELTSKKIPYDAKVKLGAMVETPAAAMIAVELARETDFLSIGTNDLIQYTLAVDRGNEDVSYLFEPLHPAVLRLLKIICDAGKSQNIDISVCGEMAGNPLYFMILLGLGFAELSMNPVSIPKVKRLIRAASFRHANEMFNRAITCKTSTEIEHLIKRETAKITGFPKL